MAPPGVQGMVSPFAVEMLLPAFLNGLAVKAKPPQKEATLQIISALAAKAPRAVGYLHLGGAAEPGGKGSNDVLALQFTSYVICTTYITIYIYMLCIQFKISLFRLVNRWYWYHFSPGWLINEFPGLPGKSAAKPFISWENLWFPVDFPLVKPIHWLIEWSNPLNTNSYIVMNIDRE